MICTGHHMRGEAISVLSLERRYHKCHISERNVFLYTCAFIRVRIHYNIYHCPNATIIKMVGQKQISK